MIVVIDNTRKQKIKMFLPKLLQYLDDNYVKYVVIKGDVDGMKALKRLNTKSIKGVILSGSPLMPSEDTNIDGYVCNLYCIKNFTKIPIIGICFGCEIINLFFGGTLHNMGNLMCKKANVRSMIKDFDDIVEAKFCAQYVPNCVPPKVFDILMHVQIDNKAYPCMIRHRKRSIIGVMFHPEALRRTHKVLDTFLRMCDNQVR